MRKLSPLFFKLVPFVAKNSTTTDFRGEGKELIPTSTYKNSPEITGQQSDGVLSNQVTSEVIMESANLLEAKFDDDYVRNSVEFQPWMPKSEADLKEQALIKTVLTKRAGAKHFGKNSYIARGANIFTSSFKIGDNSWIAAGVIIRGHVSIGNQCSVNPYAHIAGSVKIGNGVRIAGHSSIYGFNHGFSRLNVPIYAQPHTTKGITIGNNCWIGTNTVLVDGITLGNDCIVAGGAVVTTSFPDFSIIGGNPAKLIRNRKIDGEVK